MQASICSSITFDICRCRSSSPEKQPWQAKGSLCGLNNIYSVYLEHESDVPEISSKSLSWELKRGYFCLLVACTNLPRQISQLSFSHVPRRFFHSQLSLDSPSVRKLDGKTRTILHGLYGLKSSFVTNRSIQPKSNCYPISLFVKSSDNYLAKYVGKTAHRHVLRALGSD